MSRGRRTAHAGRSRAPDPRASGGRLPPALLRELGAVVGADGVISEPGRLIPYESDALTRFRQLPEAVVLPRDTDEAARVVRLLAGADVPLTPRGAGTGLSGGGVAVRGGVLVGTSRMNRIMELDARSRLARVQAGVVNADLSAAAAPFGLHYAPDPSSQTACTLGGNVGENAGGPHCLKYGVTTRYVTGLTVVTGSGEVVRLGGAGSCEGLDLVGLFVGSEGRLGLATEIELRLVPRARAVRTLLAVFPSTETAGAAVSSIIAAGLLPAAMEIMDQGTIQAVEASIYAAGYPTDAGAVLVVEFDGTEAGLDAEAEAAADHCRGAGATQLRRARSEAERAALWQGRKKAYGAFGRITPDLMVQDATVPRSALPEVLARIAEIGRSHRLRVANVFHAGDGNLHPKILFDRRDPELVERVEKASKEMMRVCVEAGGTITGEHGVGLDKRDYMHLVHGPDELAVMRGVQRVFDPRGVWNPGKVLPPDDTAAGRPDPDMAGSGGPDDPWRVRPASVSQVRSRLARASREGTPVRIRGRLPGPGTSPLPSSEEGVVVLLTDALPSGVEHAPDDLTVTVGAGCTVGALQASLARGGQWLPVDVPGSREWTVGELVARGEWGPLAPAYGRIRDLVLGCQLVAGDGRLLRLGGRVMKNVAGFDLVRAVSGSRGRWGVITSATFRLMPLPRAHAVLTWEGPAESTRTLARELAAHPVLPASTVREWTPEGTRIRVGLHGSEAAVAAEADEILRLFPGAAVQRSAPASEAGVGVERLTEDLEGHGEGGTLLELRPGGTDWEAVEVGLTPLRAAGACVYHMPLWDVWRISFPVDAAPRTGLASLRDAVRAHGGDLCRLRGRSHLQEVEGTAAGARLGEDGGAGALAAGVCRVFDPAGILRGGPGRTEPQAPGSGS